MSVQPPRGWNRPVKPVALVVVGATLLAVWLLLFTASVWYFYGYWEARFTLRDQPVALRLPVNMQALAEVQSPLRSRLDVSPTLRLPIHQTLTAQIQDSLDARVQLSTTLPIDTEVTVDQDVPVRTTVTLSVPLRSWLPPIPVTLPVDVMLPVHMVVPVHAQVPVVLDVHATGELPPSLRIPLDTTFVLKPSIHADLTARMVGRTEFRLLAPLEPFPVQIEKAALRVPFNLTVLGQPQP
jgi:hypothetical protein